MANKEIQTNYITQLIPQTKAEKGYKLSNKSSFVQMSTELMSLLSLNLSYKC